MSSDHPEDLESRTSTAALLRQVRGGDADAVNILAGRYIETLRRIAHGRLPHTARERYDTEELVQETVLRGLGKAEQFEDRGEGAFLAYLRRILVNLVYDEVRRAARRPREVEVPEVLPDPQTTPLAGLIDKESQERYEAALAFLPEADRQAVELRIEGYSYEDVARGAKLPSANAARMRVNRALAKLGEHIKGNDEASQG